MIAAKVAPIPLGAILLDTDEVLTDAALDAAIAYGASGVIRYVGFGVKPWANDLALPETQRILGKKLGVVVCQHPRRALWLPTAGLGRSDGEAGTRHTLAAGIERGTSLIDDLEGIVAGAAASTIAYANTKWSVVTGEGFEQAEYIGDRCPLDSQALYHELQASLYHRAGSLVPDVAVRGYAMLQHIPGPTLAGIHFDRNVHTGDKLGGVFHWTIRDDCPPAPTPLEVA